MQPTLEAIAEQENVELSVLQEALEKEGLLRERNGEYKTAPRARERFMVWSPRKGGSPTTANHQLHCWRADAVRWVLAKHGVKRKDGTVIEMRKEFAIIPANGVRAERLRKDLAKFWVAEWRQEGERWLPKSYYVPKARLKGIVKRKRKSPA